MRKLNPFMTLGYFIVAAVFLEMWDACKKQENEGSSKYVEIFPGVFESQGEPRTVTNERIRRIIFKAEGVKDDSYGGAPRMTWGDIAPVWDYYKQREK